MQLKALKRIDLNLLVALQILLEESNVSRAAERLFITQPAMSKTLGRLRDVFSDPLFIRGPHGIRPTPRALELKTALGPILEDIDTLIAPVVFDPSNFIGEVSIAVSEFIGIAIVPLLMKELQNEDPSLRIKTMSRLEHQLDHLADGDFDIAIHIQRDRYGTDFNPVCIEV
jgi:DNA-binding transcriptional LysR family regulator